MTEQDFMVLALGADRDKIMEVLNLVLKQVGTPFTAEEAAVMARGLEMPEVRMEIATMLTDGARKAGVFK